MGCTVKLDDCRAQWQSQRRRQIFSTAFPAGSQKKHFGARDH
jgi:hypothetical protein